MPTFIVKNDSQFSLPIELSESDQRHLLKALRARVGEELYFTNLSGQRLHARITKLNPLEFEKIKITTQVAPHNLVVHLPLIDSDRFEWAVEKLTELNVKKIVPIWTERTQSRELSPSKKNRIQKIIREAIIQSGRAWDLDFAEVVSLPESLQINCDQKFFGDVVLENSDSVFKKTNGEIGIWIGPEGGWAPSERELLLEHATPVSCGDTVLRAETAAVAICSFLIL